MAVLTLGVLLVVSVASPTSAQRKSARPVRVATLNLLHGLFCNPDVTDWCKAPARVDILGEWLERAECPDVVGLQEMNERLEQLLPAMLDGVCGGVYEIATEPVVSPDREFVLSRLPIVDRGYLDIASFPWEAYWVRVVSTQGPVDFLTTHFASSSNNPPCTAEICPPVCAPGLITNECHAQEVVDFFEHRADPARLTIVAGDLNARPGSPTLATFTDAGYGDAWLDAGRRECDPATGRGCTGCSETDTELIGMDTVEGLECDARIDFVLARPGNDCKRLRSKAGGFAHRPLRTPIDGMYWPSDHHGVQATFRCR